MTDGWVVMGMPDGYDDVVFLTKFGCLPLALLDTPHIPGVTNLIDNQVWTRKVWSRNPIWAKRFSKAGAREMKKFLAESYRDRGEKRVVLRAIPAENAQGFVVGAAIKKAVDDDDCVF
jgi:hypothetical protein